MDDIYIKKKENLLIQAEKLQNMADSLSAHRVKNELGNLIKKLQNEHFFVTVVGEFNRGKSTLMNALLGENILPTAIRPTTALLTFIHNDTKKIIRVYDKKGFSREVSWNKKALKEFTALNDVDMENFQFMELSTLLMDFPRDLVLVDTPGVNDVSQQRMDVTYKYIPVSDAVIFVLSAKQPLTQSEWTFLQDFVSESSRRHFFFIINFKDTVINDELLDVVRVVKRRLTKLISEENIHIYVMSAKMALKGKENKDMTMLKDSGYLVWQNDFQGFLQDESRQYMKLSRYQEQLRKIKKMFLEFIALREQENQIKQTDIIAMGKALQDEKVMKKKEFDSIQIRLKEMQGKWTQEVKALLQNTIEDFIQEQRININMLEREKDIIRYAEEVLPLAIQRYWKQWLEYRQDQILNMVNNDLQGLAQAYCDTFSERQIFFDICQRAQVQIIKQQPLCLDGKEDIEQAETIGQLGTAVVIGGMALLSGFSLVAVPLIAFGGKNLGSFITQKFYVDEKLQVQQTQLKEELERVMNDTYLLIEKALLQEIFQTADKMLLTLQNDFQLIWQELEHRMNQNRDRIQYSEVEYQTEHKLLESCKKELLLKESERVEC